MEMSKRRAVGEEKRRTKVERDREFARVCVFLDAVCVNVTAFKGEYIVHMYPRCTRSGLRLTRALRILANYIQTAGRSARENAVINFARIKVANYKAFLMATIREKCINI